MASVGFGVSALVQNKLFTYHFLPAWGYLFVFLVSTIALERRYIRTASVALLSAAIVVLCLRALPWIYDSGGRHKTIPELVRGIDEADSFAVFSVHPFPAFPTALYTSTRYVGLSSSHWFLPAVGKLESGEAEGSLQVVSDLALNQALDELERRPELVIVDTNWRRHTGLKSNFDGLAWLQHNVRFRTLWSHYTPAGKIGDFQLFKRSGVSLELHDKDVGQPAQE
jgi:hypothetical protein